MMNLVLDLLIERYASKIQIQTCITELMLGLQTDTGEPSAYRMVFRKVKTDRHRCRVIKEEKND